LLDFLYELYYDAWIHKHQLKNIVGRKWTVIICLTTRTVAWLL